MFSEILFKLKKMFNFVDSNIDYKRKRIVRVTIHLKNGGTSSGTGFFISQNDKILTCFHVAFGQELRRLKNNPEYKKISIVNEHERLKEFHQKTIDKIEVELFDGSKEETSLEKFNQDYDIVLLSVKKDSLKTEAFNLNYEDSLNYGDKIFFCGFQHAVDYKSHEYPFSVNTGIVSSFPETVVGGGKYKHIQINSINLGGNSGAPLFKENSNKVIGIINGNMNWGSDNLAFVINNINQEKRSLELKKGSLRVPLSIAYATSLKLLKEKTTII